MKTKRVSLFWAAGVICCALAAVSGQDLTAGRAVNAGAYYDEGVRQAQQGNLSAAKSAFEQATLLDPGLALAYVQLGLVAERAGKREEAQVYFRQAVQVKPELANHPLLRSKQEIYARGEAAGGPAEKTATPAPTAGQKPPATDGSAGGEGLDGEPLRQTTAPVTLANASQAGGAAGARQAKSSKWHTLGRTLGAVFGGAATQIIQQTTFGGPSWGGPLGGIWARP